MAFETEGVLHKVFDTENKTQTFQTREFVIKQDGNYPQFIKFQLTQDRCDLINNFKEGENVKVSFDLRGREWNERYFTNLNAWRIESGAAAEQEIQSGALGGTTTPSANQPAEPASNTSSETLTAEDFDDLPF